jgi:4-hydroxybenzoate polyprenyltransferase
MIERVRRLLEMIRFSHTLFALPFALLSATLAWHEAWHSWPQFWLQLSGILLCMVFARSTAMAFNRLSDRDVDAGNLRTARRHLVTGELSVSAVWVFTAVCALGFIGSSAVFLLARPSNPWPLYLSLPFLLFICAYSLTKRFTALCHFWLGASLLLAPLGAWIAIRGLDRLEVPFVLGAAVFFWVAGFDILYACQDVEFDRQANLHSVPARLGVALSLRVAMLCHFLMVAMLLVLYWAAQPHLGWVYLGGLGLIALLLAYEHWLVRPDDLTRVNQAFFQVNGVVSVGLFVVVLLQLWIGN